MSLKLQVSEHEILIDALNSWGHEEQFGMANEEFGECITAINQYRRGRINKEMLASEVADAFIMANQLAIIVGEEEVQKQIGYKLRRLRGRLIAYNNPIKSEGVQPV